MSSEVILSDPTKHGLVFASLDMSSSTGLSEADLAKAC